MGIEVKTEIIELTNQTTGQSYFFEVSLPVADLIMDMSGYALNHAMPEQLPDTTPDEERAGYLLGIIGIARRAGLSNSDIIVRFADIRNRFFKSGWVGDSSPAADDGFQVESEMSDEQVQETVSAIFDEIIEHSEPEAEPEPQFQAVAPMPAAMPDFQPMTIEESFATVAPAEVAVPAAPEPPAAMTPPLREVSQPSQPAPATAPQAVEQAVQQPAAQPQAVVQPAPQPQLVEQPAVQPQPVEQPAPQPQQVQMAPQPQQQPMQPQVSMQPVVQPVSQPVQLVEEPAVEQKPTARPVHEVARPGFSVKNLLIPSGATEWDLCMLYGTVIPSGRVYGFAKDATDTLWCVTVVNKELTPNTDFTRNGEFELYRHDGEKFTLVATAVGDAAMREAAYASGLAPNWNVSPEEIVEAARLLS